MATKHVVDTHALVWYLEGNEQFHRVPYQALIKEAVIRAHVDPEHRKPDKA